ncbi:MAG: type II toxin-antitoxin system VapC family toxin [Treponema sp.]|nr:type II toxin-antitoxin system VapC family toxin [Treponema sp.]
MDYVLDACALITLFNEEEGADLVTELMIKANDGSDHLFINIIQVMEVYYDRIYIKGTEYADKVLESIYTSPITVLHDISREIIKEAARFKTSYSMSLADTFAVATARNLNAFLVTKDDEMKDVEEAGELKILWLK